jgi:alpha-1,6-mannosyltransferase
LLSTTVHPWYVATPLLLSVFTKYKFPLVWSFMVFLSYAAYSDEGFSENLALVAIEYSAVIAVALWEFFQNKKQDSCATENREVITN